MLVIDLHALQTVNLLNLIHDVLLNLDRTEYVENVGRGYGAVGKTGSGPYVVVLLNEYLLGHRHEIGFLDT